MCALLWENSARRKLVCRERLLSPKGEAKSTHRHSDESRQLGKFIPVDRQLLHQSVSNLYSQLLIQQVDRKAEGCFFMYCLQLDPSKEECRGREEEKEKCLLLVLLFFLLCDLSKELNAFQSHKKCKKYKRS